MNRGRRDVVGLVAACKHRRMRYRRLTCFLLAAGMLGASCGVADGSDGGASSTTAITPKPDEVLSAKAVLARLRGSVALLDTPIASGSAVLTEGGYLVTNAHVVEPFDVVDVTFEGEDAKRDVAVVGVDLSADIAVLGPIETDHKPLAIADPTGLDQGSELFLVGYPGDQEDPEVTITSGVLSRRREAKEWGLSFLQSDAKIAPGQSGGALVDDHGQVIGISGLSDEDDYALSLAGDNVVDSVKAILADDGSTWEPAPHTATDRSESFTMAGPADVRLLYLPATAQDRKVTIGVTGTSPAVELDDVGQYPLGLNQAAYDAYEGGVDSYGDDLPPATKPDADGRWTFPIDAGYPAVLAVSSGAQRSTPLQVTSTEPFAVVSGDPDLIPLKVNSAPRTGTSGYLDVGMIFSLALVKGDKVDIVAQSAIGDMAFAVVAPGEVYDGSQQVDDGGGGLFDQDAAGSYTAAETGTYALRVGQVEGTATEFRLTVKSA